MLAGQQELSFSVALGPLRFRGAGEGEMRAWYRELDLLPAALSRLSLRSLP
jgi:hypothetical protein